MEETIHSPAPQESRGIYGFVFFMTCNLCIILYFAWVLIPSEWTRSWPYEPPQKYWAAAIPILFCTALFLFAFCIYPALHSRHDGELDVMNAITDQFALPKEPREDSTTSGERIVLPPSFSTFPRLKQSKSKRKPENTEQIPQISDLDLIDVCKTLYLQNNS